VPAVCVLPRTSTKTTPVFPIPSIFACSTAASLELCFQPVCTIRQHWCWHRQVTHATAFSTAVNSNRERSRCTCLALLRSKVYFGKEGANHNDTYCTKMNLQCTHTCYIRRRRRILQEMVLKWQRITLCKNTITSRTCISNDRICICCPSARALWNTHGHAQENVVRHCIPQ